MQRKCVFGAVIVAAVISGCAGQPAAAPVQTAPAKSARELAIEQATPIRTEPAVQPDWVTRVPDSPEKLSFVGISNRLGTVATANNNARYNGTTQLVEYYGTQVANKARTFTATAGITTDTLAPEIIGQELNERLAEGVSQALAPRETYTKVYLDSTNRERFEVYVLMEVDKALVRRIIDDYGQEKAADLAKQAAAEQDARNRQQIEKSVDFFGGSLSSSLGF